MREETFRLAVYAAIRDDRGRFLLLRRSAKSRKFVGAWEWPGGKVDDGEGIDEAVRREVLEETGLAVALTGVAGAFMAGTRFVMLCLEARAAGGTLRLNEEHDDFAWTPAADLPRREWREDFRAFVGEYAARAGERGS